MDNFELKIALGIENLSEVEQKEILEKVDKRLEEVVMLTLIGNLSETEVKDVKDILKDGKNIEGKITDIAAGIPRLAEKMENAVAEEIERLRRVLNPEK